MQGVHVGIADERNAVAGLFDALTITSNLNEEPTGSFEVLKVFKKC